LRTLNLGILAHVDAGKTSLTERLLHAAGVIDEIGSVDAGSTQTDTLALERQRGITIKSAVVAFALDDVTVNLIDTPGHPDFIAEVERVLSVLDGAVLVVSAVEGVQAQTRVLMRALQRLRIPTLLFVNKIDRGGAQYRPLLESIAAKLSPSIVAMSTVTDIGTRRADAVPHAEPDDLLNLVAQRNDDLLKEYVETGTVAYGRLRAELATQTQNALVHPVFFGSAITGAGVGTLIDALTELLPAMEGDADGPLSGTVFKVDRGVAGEKIVYVRVFTGTVRTRDKVPFGADGGTGRGADGGAGAGAGQGKSAKVTGLSVFDGGTTVRGDEVAAGRIGRLWGLTDVRIGDAIGVPPAGQVRHHFSPPTLETVVLPSDPAAKGALHDALSQLAEQDPLIDLRQDEIRQELSVSLYGEVQKEVIQATLADDFGVAVTFRETTTICVERVAGVGTAVEFNGADDNPFLATVGLRIEPAPAGSGVTFKLGVELGSMPLAFFKTVEETVRETLLQGVHGWQVIDCAVTMTHSGYSPKQSAMHAGFDKSMSSTGWDFRYLTPLVLMQALREAGTRVHEPMHRFHLDIPSDTIGAVIPALARLRAVAETSTASDTAYALEGVIPAARVHDLERQLPSLSHGEGILESAFDHYQPVSGAVPERSRWDHNPLDRKEYLLHVQRRV
jgi:ribosomal protection tetracycline resistance protein